MQENTSENKTAPKSSNDKQSEEEGLLSKKMVIPVSGFIIFVLVALLLVSIVSGRKSKMEAETEEDVIEEVEPSPTLRPTREPRPTNEPTPTTKPTKAPKPTKEPTAEPEPTDVPNPTEAESTE